MAISNGPGEDVKTSVVSEQATVDANVLAIAATLVALRALPTESALGLQVKGDAM